MTLGEGVSVQPYAVIERGASIGAGTVDRRACVHRAGIGPGAHCHIHPHVTIRERTRHRLARDHPLRHGDRERRIRVRILRRPACEDSADRVSCRSTTTWRSGRMSTIDRARFGRTWIQEGTKIDNLVQIAHNVVIGRHSIIVSQTGISGSSKLGQYVTLAGQVGLVGHIEIGDRVIVGGQIWGQQKYPGRGDLVWVSGDADEGVQGAAGLYEPAGKAICPGAQTRASFGRKGHFFRRAKLKDLPPAARHLVLDHFNAPEIRKTSARSSRAGRKQEPKRKASSPALPDAAAVLLSRGGPAPRSARDFRQAERAVFPEQAAALHDRVGAQAEAAAEGLFHLRHDPGGGPDDPHPSAAGCAVGAAVVSRVRDLPRDAALRGAGYLRPEAPAADRAYGGVFGSASSGSPITRARSAGRRKISRGFCASFFPQDSGAGRGHPGRAGTRFRGSRGAR